jgi:hypothetical protein
MKCPVCKGTGLVSIERKPSLVDMKKIAAKELRKTGMTMREIQKLLGYKSVSTVKFLLK